MKSAQIIFWVFIFSVLSVFVYAPKIVHANQLITPTLTATPIPTSTPVVPPQDSTSPKDEVTYKDLVEHYSSVTDLVLKIIGTVVTLLGVFGIVAGYLSLKTIRDLQKLVDDITKKVKDVEDSLTRVNEVRDFSLKATNRVRYILELRSKNSDVRVRAAQQLGASNDILAVEILTDLLQNETNDNVKIEAIYGLGKLLALESSEVETTSIGINALVSGLEDTSETVRIEVIDALDYLVCNNVVLPRFVIRKLSELSSTTPKLAERLSLLLEHIQKQQETKIK